MERNHRMELQYDGTGLHGWAKQDGLRTVEGCLEEAFRTALGHAPLLRVAGRTDAGVHARRQVVSLLLPAGADPAKLRRSLNALTPPGIAVLDLRPAPAAFDARRDATSRSYRYYVCAEPVMSPFWDGYCWQVCGYDLDPARHGGGGRAGGGPPPLHRLHSHRDQACLLRPNGPAVPLGSRRRCGTAGGGRWAGSH